MATEDEALRELGIDPAQAPAPAEGTRCVMRYLCLRAPSEANDQQIRDRTCPSCFACACAPSFSCACARLLRLRGRIETLSGGCTYTQEAAAMGHSRPRRRCPAIRGMHACLHTCADCRRLHADGICRICWVRMLTAHPYLYLLPVSSRPGE